MLLQATNVTQRFGGITAVDDVSLTVHAGTVHGLIGPNGAGKTTFFDCIAGVQKPVDGRDRCSTAVDVTKHVGGAASPQRPAPHVSTPAGLRLAVGRGQRAARARVARRWRRHGRRPASAPAAASASSGERRRTHRRGPGPMRPARPPREARRWAVDRRAPTSRAGTRDRRRHRVCCCSMSRPQGSRTPRSISSARSSCRSRARQVRRAPHRAPHPVRHEVQRRAQRARARSRDRARNSRRDDAERRRARGLSRVKFRSDPTAARRAGP